MNKTNDRCAVNTFLPMVKPFYYLTIRHWVIGNNAKNISKRLVSLKQLEENSGYSYFRFWCRNQRAVL
ncbi:MAG: hypothetical protein ACYDA4_12705 [Ignavibacteriaceae bacterium]